MISTLYGRPSGPSNAAGRACTAMYPPSVDSSPASGSGGRWRPGMLITARRTSPASRAATERFAHDVAHDERHVGGSFRETTHQVWIPLRSERNVHAHSPALAHEPL